MPPERPRLRPPGVALFGRPFEEVQAGEPRKAVDPSVNPARSLATLVAGEEMAGEESGLGGGHDTGADRVPEPSEGETCDPPSPVAGGEWKAMGASPC